MEEEQQVKVTETTTQTTGQPGTQQTQQVTTAQTPVPSGTTVAARLVYILISLLEAMLAFRFVLSLLGANKGNVFADAVYGATEPFVWPFLNLFNYQTTYGTSRVELETLVAMAVYAVLAAVIVALLRLPRRPSTV